MKYNEKYGKWFTKGGLVYRYSKAQDKLVLCKQSPIRTGYMLFSNKDNKFYVHRAIYETFVGPIPDGYEIDHINTKRDDNRVENLRAVTHAENNKNPLTNNHRSEARLNKSYSIFGKKYFEHFGYSCRVNRNQYAKELMWYKKHGKCRWE